MFFHILLWNENENANRAFIEKGMHRMQKENHNDMKRLTFGYLLEGEEKSESQSGTFIKKNNEFIKIDEPYQSFFLMDFEDEDAYLRYISSEAHDGPKALHPKPGFAWEVCAKMWGKYLATDFLYESAFPIVPKSIHGNKSIMHMVLWEMTNDVTENTVNEMFIALKDFNNTIPNISNIAFGRKFLGTSGSECLVHQNQLVERGAGPLPYEKINESPKFGLIVEFKDRIDLDNYRNSQTHQEFVKKYVKPYWTKIYRHELEINYG